MAARDGDGDGDVVVVGPEGRAVATRDGFGGEPLYARVWDDVAIVARDLGAIERTARAMGRGREAKLDADVLAARAAHLPAPPRATVLRDVIEIPTGTRATVGPGRALFEPLEPPAVREAPAPARRAKALRQILEAAVARALAGETRAGILTGGGLDSGALLALAHAHMQAGTRVEVRPFAIDYAADGDDRPHLAALAEALGVEPCRLALEDAELPESLEARGLPLTWPSAAHEATLLARAKAWGATRVLCGLYADELFDGDPEAASEIAREGDVAGAIDLARRYDGAPLAIAALRVALPIVREALPREARSVARAMRTSARGPFDGPRLARVRRETWERERDAGASRTGTRARPRDAAERIEAAFRSRHLAAAAELRAQEEALSGVARVDPFVDPEVIAFARSLPPAALLAGTGRRGLFREALAGLVPESVRTRADKASFAPVHASLFRAPLVRRLAPYARFEALADLGIADRRAAHDGWANACADEEYARRNGAALYALLACEAYARRRAT